jgi:predicted branched-subunit amino acid permease
VDAAFPVILVAMVLPDLRRRPTLLAALAAAVVSVSATPVVPSGLAAVCALVVLLPWALSTRRSA